MEVYMCILVVSQTVKLKTASQGFDARKLKCTLYLQEPMESW